MFHYSSKNMCRQDFVSRGMHFRYNSMSNPRGEIMEYVIQMAKKGQPESSVMRKT